MYLSPFLAAGTLGLAKSRFSRRKSPAALLAGIQQAVARVARAAIKADIFHAAAIGRKIRVGHVTNSFWHQEQKPFIQRWLVPPPEHSSGNAPEHFTCRNRAYQSVQNARCGE